MGILFFQLLFVLTTSSFSQTDSQKAKTCPQWPDTFGKQPDVCRSRWGLAYVHDSQGQALASDISLLMTAVREGWNIKVDFDQEDLGILTTPWRVYIKSSGVCAEVLVHLGVQWSFLTKCTNGIQGKKTYLLDTDRYANLHKSRSGVTSWFVRKETSAVSTAEAEVELQRGSGVRIVVDKRNRSDPLANYSSTRVAFVVPYDKPATAENIWVHEIDFSDPEAIFPSNNNDWRFRRWFTDDTFTLEDRPISSSGGVVTADKYLNPAIWFVDPCWELVFVSRSDPLESANTLLYYIRKGHRIKAIFQGVSMEADTIFVRNNHITAQFVSQVARDSGKMMWVWQLVSATGHIQTVTNIVGTRQHRAYLDTWAKVEWYVNTRPWQEILAQRRRYIVTCGSTSAYTYNVGRGKDIRLALHYGGYSQYVTPDSVGLESNLQASFNRGIGYDIDWKVPNGIKFHLPPYWDFFFLRSGPSRYYFQRLRRRIGARLPVIGHKPSLRSVQWFAA